MGKATFVGVYRLAEALGVSATGVRNYERSGRIPPAERVDCGGVQRRVWPADAVPSIVEAVERERAARRPANQAS